MKFRVKRTIQIIDENGGYYGTPDAAACEDAHKEYWPILRKLFPAGVDDRSLRIVLTRFLDDPNIRNVMDSMLAHKVSRCAEITAWLETEREHEK